MKFKVYAWIAGVAPAGCLSRGRAGIVKKKNAAPL